MARFGLCSAVLVMSVGGCEASARNATTVAKPSVPLYSEGAAAAVADALLAAVPLPPDTHRITGPLPGEKLGKRPVWGPTPTPKSVDRPAFWLSTDRPKAILSFILQKGPIPKPGFGGEGSAVLSASLGSPLAGPRELVVTTVPDGVGHYAVRVDAVVTWHKRRPANSLVPATPRWLSVTVVTPAFRAWNPGEPSRAHTTKSVITTDTSTIGAVARAVNELPLAEPSGRGPSCPLIEPAHDVYDAPRYQLTFRASARTRNLARVIGVSGFVCEREGSDTAKIATPAEPQGVQLTDHLDDIWPSKGDGLTEHLELAFHHSLHLIPET